MNAVIVQAGGRGSRLGHHTSNKPKCLVPVFGRPILYHLGRAFPGSKFRIIADYRRDVLAAYLSTFPPPYEYELVPASGSGTCAGVQAALELGTPDEPVTIVWSDLYFPDAPRISESSRVLVGISGAIPCRWRLGPDGLLREEASRSDGVIGLFVAPRRSLLPRVPDSGEFVRFLREANVPVEAMPVPSVRELRDLDALDAFRSGGAHSRFFNEVILSDETVTKRARDPSFESLLEDEVRWYHYVVDRGFPNIPRILSYEPLVMERVRGAHPYELDRLSTTAKREFVARALDCLDRLHALGHAPVDLGALRQVYAEKTLDRIRLVRPVLPSPHQESFLVNGRKVRNILHPRHSGLVARAASTLVAPEEFAVIHGDPTFSNMMVRQPDGEIVLFDPRGRFGSSTVFGDPLYDFAKLYYSVVGSYDAFNRGQFEVDVEGGSVSVRIPPSGWEECETVFAERFGNRMRQLRTLHALIWLSLAGYVRDDVDAIWGAFFHGLDLLEVAQDGT